MWGPVRGRGSPSLRTLRRTISGRRLIGLAAICDARWQNTSLDAWMQGVDAIIGLRLRNGTSARSAVSRGEPCDLQSHSRDTNGSRVLLFTKHLSLVSGLRAAPMILANSAVMKDDVRRFT